VSHLLQISIKQQHLTMNQDIFLKMLAVIHEKGINVINSSHQYEYIEKKNGVLNFFKQAVSQNSQSPSIGYLTLIL